ncbi:MAG: hypothetical protein HC819_07870 [Cyclobacteriaceae bacterium]|nr:hypothetical protein [Cyclobacteriaceae bacterium]
MKFKNRNVKSAINLLFLLLLGGCSPPNGDEIVDKALALHGGSLYENSVIDFDFRGRHYTLERDDGLFRYHRIFLDSTGQYHDVLSNSGFERTLNGRKVPLTPEWEGKYSNSINSVAYFALLPFGLNDAAVNKAYLGEESIKGQNYYKIRVTFDQQGGGQDHEDVFVYWFRADTYRMDYLAYSYQTEEGGMRFRKAVNQREVGGIRFADYINYAAEKGNWNVEALASGFEQNELEQLSEIKLENVEVKRTLLR